MVYFKEKTVCVHHLNTNSIELLKALNDIDSTETDIDKLCMNTMFPFWYVGFDYIINTKYIKAIKFNQHTSHIWLTTSPIIVKNNRYTEQLRDKITFELEYDGSFTDYFINTDIIKFCKEKDDFPPIKLDGIPLIYCGNLKWRGVGHDLSKLEFPDGKEISITDVSSPFTCTSVRHRILEDYEIINTAYVKKHEFVFQFGNIIQCDGFYIDNVPSSDYIGFRPNMIKITSANGLTYFINKTFINSQNKHELQLVWSNGSITIPLKNESFEMVSKEEVFCTTNQVSIEVLDPENFLLICSPYQRIHEFLKEKILTWPLMFSGILISTFLDYQGELKWHGKVYLRWEEGQTYKHTLTHPIDGNITINTDKEACKELKSKGMITYQQDGLCITYS